METKLEPYRVQVFADCPEWGEQLADWTRFYPSDRIALENATELARREFGAGVFVKVELTDDPRAG